MAEEAPAFEGWAILELMGHRRLGGYVRLAEMFGAALCRIDVPGQGEGEVVATQFYGGSSIYCLTPTTEAMARAVALRNQPEPVQRWELLEPKQEFPARNCVMCNRYFKPSRANQQRCPECEEEINDMDGECQEEGHTVDQLPY